MTAAFRNVEVLPGTPVRRWPYGALTATLERGMVNDWAKLIREIDQSPWGTVARAVERYLTYESPYGVGPLLQRAIARARAAARAHVREAVATQVRTLKRRSGLSSEEFAREIGTSRSRLSTYTSGRVVLAATLIVRMRRVADRGQSLTALTRRRTTVPPTP